MIETLKKAFTTIEVEGTEPHSPVVVFIALYNVVLMFSLRSVTILSMKAAAVVGF